MGSPVHTTVIGRLFFKIYGDLVLDVESRVRNGMCSSPPFMGNLVSDVERGADLFCIASLPTLYISSTRLLLALISYFIEMRTDEKPDTIKPDQRTFNRVFLELSKQQIDKRWDTREDCCKDLKYRPEQLSRYISGDFHSYMEFLQFLYDIGLTLYVANDKKEVARFPGQKL